jgi:hypothetical protein
VRSMGSTLGGFDQGVIAALDERGALARVDRQFGYHYGTQRTAAPSQVSEVWYLSEEGRYGNELRALPGAREIAAVSPLPRSEEQELRRLEARVSAALVAAGREDLASSIDSAFLGELIEQARRQGPLPGVDTQDVEHLVALNARVARAHECRCVIVAFSAQDATNLPFTLG